MNWLASFTNRAAARLSRVTSSGRYIPELDGLRFVAIGAVFLQHVQQHAVSRLGGESVATWDVFSNVNRHALMGVELFFVISGFILGLPFAEQHLCGGRPVSLKQYYFRRLTRLEPPYVISLTVFFILLLVYKHRLIADVFPHYLASLFYVHNIVYGQQSTINPVAWSLEIEVQFYVLAPLLAKLFLLRPRAFRTAAIVGLAVLAFVVRHATEKALQLGDMPTLLAALPYFLAGFLMADVFVSDWRGGQPSSTAWDAAAVVSAAALIAIFFLPIPARSLAEAAILFVFVYASFGSRWVKLILRSTWIRTIGGMCYSIYLLHYIAIKALAEQTPREWFWQRASIDTAVFGIAYGIPILAVSMIFFLLIEKPCMRKDWPAKLWAAVSGRKNNAARDPASS